jgi:hypothetical protein
MSKTVLGEILTKEGHYPEAEKMLQDAYDSLLRVVGKDNEYTAQAAYHLAELRAAEAQKSDALTWLGTAVDDGLPDEEDPGSNAAFKSLNGDPTFAAIVARQHAKSAAATKAAGN